MSFDCHGRRFPRALQESKTMVVGGPAPLVFMYTCDLFAGSLGAWHNHDVLLVWSSPSQGGNPVQHWIAIDQPSGEAQEAFIDLYPHQHDGTVGNMFRMTFQTRLLNGVVARSTYYRQQGPPLEFSTPGYPFFMGLVPDPDFSLDAGGPPFVNVRSAGYDQLPAGFCSGV